MKKRNGVKKFRRVGRPRKKSLFEKKIGRPSREEKTRNFMLLLAKSFFDMVLVISGVFLGIYAISYTGTNILWILVLIVFAVFSRTFIEHSLKKQDEI